MTVADTDLFGDPVLGCPPPPLSDGKRKKTVLNGYAATPGTGPAGKTCRDCQHYARVRHAKAYRKCLLMRGRWTGGPGTDILAGSPACSKFQQGKGVDIEPDRR